jgi:branched-chain amino acid aminotransferase
MSAQRSSVPEAPPRSGSVANARIRPATAEDAAAVAAAVESLLIELGGERPAAAALKDAARTLAADPELGALLVAECEGAIVGVCATSWQYVVHVPGRYGTIQDLWVHPDWRSRALGHELILALVRQATELGVPRLEVGLPQEGFAQLAATERFYRENDFTPLGPRMRRLLS